ncbi:hypothetical protein [Rhodococcus sp. 24CO]
MVLVRHAVAGLAVSGLVLAVVGCGSGANEVVGGRSRRGGGS